MGAPPHLLSHPGLDMLTPLARFRPVATLTAAPTLASSRPRRGLERWAASFAAAALVLHVLGAWCAAQVAPPEQVHRDRPFRQERAVVYRNEVDLEGLALRRVRADRDGNVLVNTDRGLLRGYEGRLVRYQQLAGVADHDHRDLGLLGGKFVFLTHQLLLPLDGAGRDFRHNFGGRWHQVAVAGPGRYLLLGADELYEIDGETTRRRRAEGFEQVAWDPYTESYLLFGPRALARYTAGEVTLLPAPSAELTAVAPGPAWPGESESATQDGILWLATTEGLFRLAGDERTAHPRRLPVRQLTAAAVAADGRLWLGSPRGAFCLDADGGLDYYAGRRWLPDDHVLDVHPALDGRVYLLTRGGLAHLEFEMMTLADKAAHYQRNLRQHHIRYGMVSDAHVPGGDYALVRQHDSDNDGLWSGMYLAAEAFRYAATGQADALENAVDGFDALERLVTLPTVKGLQARSFELDGFAVSDKDRWRRRPERDFEWKGHTSSDEIVGTFFFHSIFHDLVARGRPELAARSRAVVEAVMDHILEHDLYLVDIDGEPTLWGRWNPEYVNTPQVGGDRRLNSIEILSFLQLAYHVSGDEKYRDAWRQLVRQHGYAENTVRYLPNPLGPWNHSDDELYWLSYWMLLRHASDDDLVPTYRASAHEHAQATARKRNPLWNLIYGATTGDSIDLAGTIWVLQNYPLDLRNWRMRNSHRLDVDIEKRRGVAPETVEPLPPDERAVTKWNSNEMRPDGGGSGDRAESGAEFLLPYWMGRYFGYISPPEHSVSDAPQATPAAAGGGDDVRDHAPGR